MDGLTAYRYIVKGRVQGVGYRYFVARLAGGLGVNGYARNRSDGTVEVIAEAEEPALADLEAKLRVGPPFARVEDVERRPIAPRGDEGFHIR